MRLATFKDDKKETNICSDIIMFRTRHFVEDTNVFLSPPIYTCPPINPVKTYYYCNIVVTGITFILKNPKN